MENAANGRCVAGLRGALLRVRIHRHVLDLRPCHLGHSAPAVFALLCIHTCPHSNPRARFPHGFPQTAAPHQLASQLEVETAHPGHLLLGHLLRAQRLLVQLVKNPREELNCVLLRALPGFRLLVVLSHTRARPYYRSHSNPRTRPCVQGGAYALHLVLEGAAERGHKAVRSYRGGSRRPILGSAQGSHVINDSCFVYLKLRRELQ
mmetsp:Transcript_4480/g.10107  ORF Transcript_4480/g.10107 Transcript_4480/m.10107 type:complete len:206 (-) Transcript_4480:928-1545(-)